MTTALLSPKFQIVIPKEIRRAMKLRPGQRLELVQKDGTIEVRPILTPDQLIGFLKDGEPLEFERDKTDRPF